jgi:hypothetical protein
VRTPATTPAFVPNICSLVVLSILRYQCDSPTKFRVGRTPTKPTHASESERNANKLANPL